MRSALNALRKARRSALRAGLDLSEWEEAFLGSVKARLETHGRAFADPEKGASGQALSLKQASKVREITAKARAKGDVGAKPLQKSFGQVHRRRRSLRSTDSFPDREPED
jgi:hypothetical protein